MCSPIGDGAAGVDRRVARGPQAARRRPRAGAGDAPCARAASAHGGDSAVTRAARAAYRVAGVGPADVDVVEVHDAAAPGELIASEELGIAAPGEGVAAAARRRDRARRPRADQPERRAAQPRPSDRGHRLRADRRADRPAARPLRRPAGRGRTRRAGRERRRLARRRARGCRRDDLGRSDDVTPENAGPDRRRHRADRRDRALAARRARALRQGRPRARHGATAVRSRRARLDEGRVPAGRRARPRVGRRAGRRRRRRRPPRVHHLRRPRGDPAASTWRDPATSSRPRVAAGTRRLVYTSSVAAYGLHPDSPDVLTEDLEPRGNGGLLLLGPEGGARGAAPRAARRHRHRGVHLPALHRRRPRRAGADQRRRQRIPGRRAVPGRARPGAARSAALAGAARSRHGVAARPP